MPTIEIGSHRIDLRVVTGKVVGLKKQSDTHVFGGGGGGSISTDYAGNVHGHISPGSISSSIVYRQEFFIRREGEPDIHQQLTEWDSQKEIPVLDGHTVTRIAAFFDGATLGSAVRLVNHDMRRFWTITPARNVFPPSTAPPIPSTGWLRVGWGVLLALLVVFQVLPAFVSSPIRSGVRTVLWVVWSLLVVVKVVRDLMVRRAKKAAVLLFWKNDADFKRFDAECDQFARSLLVQ
jgi:hypothetical protein